MLTPTSALLWETRCLLRWRIWVTLCVMLLFPGLTVFSTQRMGPGGPISSWWDMQPMHPYAQMVLTMVNLMICLMMIGQAVGMPVRQFTLPISTRTLATQRLVPGALCCAVLYVILSTLMNVMFLAGWPVLGPALTYGVGYMVMYAAVYRFRGNDTRIGITGLFMGTALLFWMGSHYGYRWWLVDEVKQTWSDLTATELVVLIAAGAAAWANLVEALERDRRGAGWGRVIHVTDPGRAVVISGPIGRRRFRSPATALFWQEWKQDGWLLPSVIGVVTFVVGALYIGGLVYALLRQPIYRMGETYEDFLMILSSVLPICAIAPWFLGLSGRHGKRAVGQQLWPTAQTSLPLSDTALGWVVMARTLASSLMAWALMIAGSVAWFFVAQLILNGFGVEQNTYPGNTPVSSWNWLFVARYFAAVTLALWVASGLSTAATLTGRWWIASIPIMVVPAWIFLMCVAAVIGHQAADWMAHGVGITVLALLLIGTAAAYILGAAWNILKLPTLLAGCVLFLIAEGVGLALLRVDTIGVRINGAPAISLYTLQIMMMLFALAAAPPALIPLATYYNRHR